jgi:hypothetical protein
MRSGIGVPSGIGFGFVAIGKGVRRGKSKVIGLLGNCRLSITVFVAS